MFFNNLCKPQEGGALAQRWWSQTAQRAASQSSDVNVVKLASAETSPAPAPVDLTRLPDAGGGISIIV